MADVVRDLLREKTMVFAGDSVEACSEHLVRHGFNYLGKDMLTSGLTGVIWSVFAGQPLVIVGVTGPVVIFTTCTYQLAKWLKIDFLQVGA